MNNEIHTPCLIISDKFSVDIIMETMEDTVEIITNVMIDTGFSKNRPQDIIF